MNDDQMTTEDFLQLSSVYALLSRLWIREVDMPLLEAMNEDDMREAYESMGGVLPEATPEVLDDLAADYCQLLIGPKNHISPVQSIWEQNKFQGDAAKSMERFTEALPGFEPPGDIIDHVGVQLAFMAELFVRASNADFPEAFEDIASRFCIEHLDWTGEFFAQVHERAQTGFYRGLAELSSHFLTFTSEEE